jgi:hypothetical protein
MVNPVVSHCGERCGHFSTFEANVLAAFRRTGILVVSNHKVLTYVEYRAVSGVFQNIDPPPPFHPASVFSPHTIGGGRVHNRRERVGGQNFGRRQT